MKMGLNSLKPKVGLTKREFILVALMFVALEGYLLFTYLLQPALNDYLAVKMRVDSANTILTSMKADFTKKADMENQIAQIDGQLKELTSQIPPYLSQEEVILLVDSLVKKDMITVQMINFDNAGAFPSIAAPAAQAPAAPSAAAAQPDQQTAAPAAAPAVAPAAAPALVSQDISLSFSGSYSQIYSFLSDIENNLRKVSVKGITLQKNKGEELTGQMKLSFVSYWDAEGQQPFMMEAAPIIGKDSPFTLYPGYSETSTKETPVVKAPIQPDFYMLINGYLDNAAKVMLSQYPKAETEASADVNGAVKASIRLDGSDGAFTYAYTVGKVSKSEKTAIKVRDGKIRMEILVQARKSEKDKVGVTLDVNNHSGMPFEITIKGDNKQNPRFILGKTVGNVIVK